jgi:hypothetical protein
MSEENIPDEHIPELDRFIGKPGDPVPVVDPADMKAVWAYQQETAARYPQGGVFTGMEVLKHLCSPGADIRAVSYRSMTLGLLELMLESAWPGGQPSESAFKVAARMELRWMAVGVPYRGLPFDVQTFLAEVRGESIYNASGLAE